jgi:glycosyltransferase involved in cell wall biosynthesis
MTLAVHTSLFDKNLLKKVDRFVVEWEGARRQLIDFGVRPDRIDLIMPPVDTRRFKPAPAPSGPFKVLFVSSPDRKEWLFGRGVDLLIETAALCPDMQFWLVWRPWGDSAAQVREWIDRRKLRNVELTVKRVVDMSHIYSQAHVTVAPFRDLEKCKPAPNSIAESLACGRPVVVSNQVGFAQMISGDGGGLVSSDDPRDLAEKLQQIRTGWANFAANARALAENKLDVARFIGAYRQVYKAVL